MYWLTNLFVQMSLPSPTLEDLRLGHGNSLLHHGEILQYAFVLFASKRRGLESNFHWLLASPGLEFAELSSINNSLIYTEPFG